ncbi:MAG: hypothetical protein IJ111_01495 [Eggerthellaceae bacterium]|nr:hypothetical protein [Eggerthellaceae bacterium]
MKRWESWTAEQDAVLREFGNHGAVECSRIISRRFHVERSPEAVRRHAYRIGASIIEYRICPGCGCKARKFYNDGFCPTCHQNALAEKNKLANTVALKEIAQTESGEEFENARRRYAKARQQKRRARKKDARKE